jgi:hypothetical protein
VAVDVVAVEAVVSLGSGSRGCVVALTDAPCCVCLHDI